LTVAEAARELGVSPSTVWRWIDARRLPAERIGVRRIRIRAEDLPLMVTPARPQPTVRPSDRPLVKHEPPSDEEIARRQKLFAEILELRRQLADLPMTATEALEEVDRERRERHESWVGIRR
jgi:excisionase family DNA binding protein